MPIRLTTLDNVKEWAGVTTTDSDNVLQRMVDQASRLALTYLERPSIFYASFTDYYDGKGSGRQFLANWPVLSISSVYAGSVLIPAAPDPTVGAGPYSGWRLAPWNGLPPGSPQSVDLYGYVFGCGNNNVKISYTAGYYISAEAHTVPGSGTNYQVQVTAPYGIWGADGGVTNASTGAALTAVAASPAVNQYVVDYRGVYTFNSANAALGVLISYSFVPADVEMSVCEWVAERYSYKGRIGLKSKSLGGQETMAYDIGAVPQFVKMALQPYMSVIQP